MWVITNMLVSFIVGACGFFAMAPLDDALASLRRGEFVLLHDSEGREDEVDMVAYAGTASPEHVARMRQRAGGLLCVAVDHEFARSVGIRYMHDILADSGAAACDKSMIMGLAPYGDRPTFSISVNSRRTYTGITDRDRSATISDIARVYDADDMAGAFAKSFRTPGHVPLLIASKNLLEERQGHTEMSIYLAKAAGLRPVMAMCEMMDAQTYAALSVDKASRFAAQHGMPLVDGRELAEYARVH